MQHIINSERRKLKKHLKQSMEVISDEYCNHDLYKENYDFLIRLPMVRNLMRSVKQLQKANDELLQSNYNLTNLLYKPKQRKQCKSLYVKQECVKQEYDIQSEYIHKCADETILVDDQLTKPTDNQLFEESCNIKYELEEAVDEEDDDDAPDDEVVIIDTPIKTTKVIIIDILESADESPLEEETALEEEDDAKVEEEEDEEEADEEADEEEAVVEAVVEEEVEEEEEEVVEEEEEEVEEEEEEDEAVVEEDEEEEVETTLEEEVEEESEVYEITIKNKKYYTTNEVDGTIYLSDINGDVGDEVGQFKNSKAVFTSSIV